MKITAIGVLILYLAPLVALIWCGISYGSVYDSMSFLKLSLRALLISFVTVAVGVGISDKIKFLQVEDGVKFYFRFFPFYLAIFFILNLWLGFELMYPQPDEWPHHS